ncbi:MAG: hypothetical protein VKJ06_07360 [Vampirovibrionales bacterium]|nr:hypothetical protein [Vampirovibrionales bacterium]
MPQLPDFLSFAGRPRQGRAPNTLITGKKRPASRGLATVLVLSMLILVTIELLVMGLLVSRSMGDEAVLSSQNTVARKAAETAIEQLGQQIQNYLLSGNSPDLAVIAFAQGGVNDIDAQALTVVNPETGSADATAAATISAWVSDRRGHYFKITSEATLGGVTLQKNRWVLIEPCDDIGVRRLVEDTAGGVAPNFFYGEIVTDPVNGWTMFQSNNNLYVWHAPNTLSALLTMPHDVAPQILADAATGRFFVTEQTIQSAKTNPHFYTWHPSTGLSTIIIEPNPASSGSSAIRQTQDGTVWLSHVGQIIGVGPRGQMRFAAWTPSDGLTISPLIEFFENQGTETSASLYSDRFPLDTQSQSIYSAVDGGIFRWSPSGGLTTLLSGGGYFYTFGLQIDETANRLFFVSSTGSSSNHIFNLWSPGAGLVTASAPAGFRHHIVNSSIFSVSAYHPTSSNYITFASHPLANSGVYRWTGTGAVTQVLAPLSGGDFADFLSQRPIADRLYFGRLGNLLAWNPSTGITSVGKLDSGSLSTNRSQVVTSPAGEVYLTFKPLGAAAATPATLYRRNPETGALISIVTNPVNELQGISNEAFDETTDRMYFSMYDGVFSYLPSAGLTTLLSGADYTDATSVRFNSSTGQLFFKNASNNVYVYNTVRQCY